jgi:hypothetical protein
MQKQDSDGFHAWNLLPKTKSKQKLLFVWKNFENHRLYKNACKITPCNFESTQAKHSDEHPVQMIIKTGQTSIFEHESFLSFSHIINLRHKVPSLHCVLKCFSRILYWNLPFTFFRPWLTCQLKSH